MSLKYPPILIIGTGAMGCLFTARISAAGFPVRMLGNWSEALETIAKSGVRLVEQDGHETVHKVQVIRTVEDCIPLRYAIVLVKSWQTEHVSRQLAECLHPDGLALTLQNGLGNREILAGLLGDERVALGVTTEGAALLEPGVVRSGGIGKISLVSQPGIRPLAGILRKAGFNVEFVSQSDSLLWGKLVINSAINPLSALLEVPNGKLLESEPACEILRTMANETALVARAQNIELPYPDPALAAENVARQTAPNRSSMLQDIQRGAPTEIEAICGAIVRAGEQVGVSTPMNWLFWKLIQSRVNCISTAIQLPIPVV